MRSARLIITLLLVLISLSVFSQKEINYKWYRLAMTHRSAGNDKQTVSDFGTFLRDYPTEVPTAYYFRGHALFRQGQDEAALNDFKTLANLEPQNPDAPFSSGLVYYRRGDYPNAIKFFSASNGLKEGNADALNYIGMSRCYMQNFDGAYKDFQQAIKLNPRFAMAYNNAGAARYFNQDIDKPIQKDIEDAEHLFTQAIRLEPKLGLAWRNRAAMRIFLKKYPEALIDLEASELLEPKEPMVYFYKGVAFSDSDDKTAALEAFRQALLLDKKHKFSYEEMGNLYKKTKQYDQAILAYTNAQSANGKKNKIYNGLMEYRKALVLAEQGADKRAFQTLKKARRLNVFKDKRVYQDLLHAKEFRSMRLKKSFRKFVSSVTRGKKENKFLTLELRWFRMRA